MNNSQGILLMIAAMAGFALEDMFIKTLSKTLPTGQILMMLGLGGAFCFATLLRLRRGTLAPLVAPVMGSRVMLIRNVGEAFSSIAFVTALSLVPISTVAAVFQATPLAITAGAALFLGDHVGWRRWSAIIVGFIGVMLIIRPGMEGFSTTALLPLIAVVGVAFRDLVTRSVPGDIPSMAIAFFGFMSLFFASLIMIFFSDPFQWLTPMEMLYMLGAITFGVSGYWAIVESMRRADTSTVMPFRYTRLIFSLIIGIIVFSERPDTLTLLGAGIIVGTGIYMVWRESRLTSR